MVVKTKIQQREKRKNRIRVKINGTHERPRLAVFRSNKYIYLQLIDDEKGKTLLAFNDQIKNKEKNKITKIESAFELGKVLAQKALEKKIQNIVFDRGGYKYHGRVKAVAEGARAGGLKF